jgi:sarcosine oxidase
MLKQIPNHYDAIVIGIGAMGSAAVYQLAKRGRRVLGLERYNIPHDQGSSHGHTRIIRLAYYEHPSYVDLLKRSYELWADIEKESQEKLLHMVGSIDAGPEGQWVFEGAWRSAKQHDLEHEVLTGAELRRRYPGYHLPPNTLCLLQPQGGFLLPERCVVNYVMQAQAHGAEIHAREEVLGWEPFMGGVKVTTTYDEYHADKLVITAGAWADHFVPELQGLSVPERQVLAWLQPTQPAYFDPSRFPVFNLLVEEGRYYGFPQYGIPGFKFGRYHHFEEVVDPDEWEREPTTEDERILREFAHRYFPDGCGPTMALASCMFTNTPDRHFIIDLHPEFKNVVIASPCSGHGFKFASVVGEIVADLAEKGQTRHDLTLFRLARFTDPMYNVIHGIETIQTGSGHGHSAPSSTPSPTHAGGRPVTPQYRLPYGNQFPRQLPARADTLMKQPTAQPPRMPFEVPDVKTFW